MSKQDRQGVRTASDLERKYDFAAISELNKHGREQDQQVSALAQTLAQFMAKVNGEISELQEKMNGFPVGAIYISLDETEPTTLFVGEWELIAKGHLLVGLDQETEEALPELQQTVDTCYLWKRTA